MEVRNVTQKWLPWICFDTIFTLLLWKYLRIECSKEFYLKANMSEKISIWKAGIC